MATGASMQPGRGPVTSDITPSVSVPSTGDDWDRIAATFDRLNQAVIRPQLIRRAERIGREQGAEIAAGEREYRPLLAFGDVAEAREAALRTVYTANTRNDIDAREAALRREYALDPQGYERASRDAVSTFIQNAPPEFAVEVETYALGRMAAGLERVADARSIRDQQETVQGFAARIATLDERLVALAAQPGGMETPEFLEAQAERNELQQERTDNPAVLYAPEQRIADDAALETDIMGANVTRLAMDAYGEAGSGIPGYAAAMRFLQQEVLDGDAFADLPPEQRQRVYRDARQQLDDYARADREEERQRRADEAAARAERRERVGEFRLGIMLGEVTEEDIRAAEGLEDSDRAGLIAASRAQARRDEAERRALRAAETTAAREVYQGFRDEAATGGLTPDELADAVGAGQITQGQARTLQGLNDRTLRPVVEDVLAPVRDEANRPGRSVRGSAREMMIAEEAAVRFARDYPDATLDQKLAAGRAIRDRVFGTNTEGRPANAQSAAQSQAARLAEVSAERARRAGTSNPMSTREYNERRQEIIDGG